MVNRCVDCNKEISKVSKRCKSCSNRNRKGKYHLSKETKRKIGEANRGNSYMKGKKHTEETKEKISNANSGKNHPNYGKELSKETRKKISKANKGKKNGMWKGEEVGYVSLHSWIKRNKPKPKLCEECNEKEPYDLANISGEYKRDVDDFEWLCRSCHMKKDGRLKNLKQFRGEENYLKN